MADWTLVQWLLADAVSWRWVVQVVMLSAGVSVASVLLFSADPRSRRGLGVVAIIALFVLPLVLLTWQPRWQIGVHGIPQLLSSIQIPNVPMVLLQGWLLLAGIVSFTFLRQVGSIRSQLSSQPLYEAPAAQTIVAQLAQRVGIKTPTLRIGESCCATSVGAPLILVPATFDTWAPDVQRAVLAHEVVHLARRDDRWLLGLQLVWRWYLFCPWLVVFYDRFVHAIEQSCDDRAAELVGDRQHYLAGLASAALAEQSDRPSSTSLTYMVQNGLVQRTQRLLDRNRFFEIQAGPLAAGMSLGLAALLLLTTFELIPAVQRIHATPIVTLQNVTAQRDAMNEGALLNAGAEEPRVEVRNSRDAPEERYTPMTIYPGIALLSGLEGQVNVAYTVAADGSVVNARVRSARPEKLFDKAALRAVRQTVYAPNHATGLPGASTTFEKQFVFRLVGSEPVRLRPTGGGH